MCHQCLLSPVFVHDVAFRSARMAKQKARIRSAIFREGVEKRKETGELTTRCGILAKVIRRYFSRSCLVSRGEDKTNSLMSSCYSSLDHLPRGDEERRRRCPILSLSLSFEAALSKRCVQLVAGSRITAPERRLLRSKVARRDRHGVVGNIADGRSVKRKGEFNGGGGRDEDVIDLRSIPDQFACLFSGL